MPAENKQAVPKLDFNTPDAGRSYIAKLFETVLRRHDYRQYISERLAGDFACTLAQHFEEIKAREDALQLLLNYRDEQLHSLEQRRQAEQQACQAAERRVEELLQAKGPDEPVAWIAESSEPAFYLSGAESTAAAVAEHYREKGFEASVAPLYRHPAEQPAPVAVCTWAQEDEAGIWNSSCGVCWSFHDDGPEENGMSFCHSCGKHLVVEVTEPEQDADWSMNPCKQGHRDVGAARGVAHCYTCDEKIEAATTQEAFERWNATHPAAQP